MSSEKNDHVIIPDDKDDRKEFSDQLDTVLTFRGKRLDKVIEAIVEKGDSISIIDVADESKSYGQDISDILDVVAYLNHMLYIHKTSPDIIKKELGILGIKENQLSEFVDRINDFSETTKKKLESLFWSSSQLHDHLYIKKITNTTGYMNVEGENGKFLGIAPTVTLHLKLEADDGRKQRLDITHTLPSLNLLIRTLLEIYFEVQNNTKEIKAEIKDKVICIPEDK